jgi:hypothetical protein
MMRSASWRCCLITFDLIVHDDDDKRQSGGSPDRILGHVRPLLRGQPFKHVARGSRSHFHVVGVHSVHCEPRLLDQSVDRPVEVAPSRSSALEGRETVLPLGHLRVG